MDIIRENTFSIKTAVIVSVVLIAAVGAYIFYSGDLGRLTKEEPREFQQTLQEGIEVSAELEKIRVLESDHSRGIFFQLEMQARITESPVTDAETGEISVQVEFDTPSGIQVPATLALGVDDTILTLLVENGNLGGTEEWLVRSVSEIKNLLHDGDPLIVRMYIDSPPQNPSFDCQEVCIAELQRIRNAHASNFIFFIAVQAGEMPETDLTVRAVSALTIYTEE